MHAVMNILLSPLGAFVLFVIAAYALYRFGDVLAPKLSDKGAKLAQYACGEDIPAKKFQIEYRMFFCAALFFTIMHVAALVIATVPASSVMLAAIGLVYLAVVLASVYALVVK
jgi:NADH:ubiquinone oxidoreductase subunit 3 (subunit A)